MDDVDDAINEMLLDDEVINHPRTRFLTTILGGDTVVIHLNYVDNISPIIKDNTESTYFYNVRYNSKEYDAKLLAYNTEEEAIQSREDLITALSS